MNCEECKANRLPQTVPYVVHESAMARNERKEKRLIAVIVLLIALLAGSNAAWVYYESQFEDVAITQESDAGDGGIAVINGEGDVDVYGNGEADD